MTLQTDNLQALEGRLRGLEKQNRRHKQALIVVMALVGCLVWMGQSPRKTRILEAEKFLLKDALGRKRAELLLEGSGPGLVLYDPNGNRLGRFGATGSGNGAGLILQGSNGESRAALMSLPEGAQLMLFDSSGKLRCELGTNPNAPSLLIHDANGKPRVALVVEAGEPRLQLIDEEGVTAILGSHSLVTPATKQTQKTGAASLVFFSKESEVLWRAP